LASLSSTGSPASRQELEQVLGAVGEDQLPVLIGSGIDPRNVADFRRASGIDFTKLLAGRKIFG
jgi:predicted TIM-barrel enzyme